MRASFDAFKVVGDQASLVDYIDQVGRGRNQGDWSAFYCQLNEAHALGTLGYRWDQGFSEANLIKFRFNAAAAGATVVILSDPLFASGSLTGEKKAEHARNMLGLPPDHSGEGLMNQLGAMKTALLMLETEKEWELIIPHALLSVSGLIESEMVIHSFRPKFGATGFHKRVGSPKWSSYDDSNVPLDYINEPPEWLMQDLLRKKSELNQQ